MARESAHYADLYASTDSVLFLHSSQRRMGRMGRLHATLRRIIDASTQWLGRYIGQTDLLKLQTDWEYEEI